MERVIVVFDSPEDAEKATRAAYQAMSPNERVALTVELQRRYYEAQHDAPRRLQRVLLCLNARDVKYLIVGGHAVSFHGYPRFTHDIDIVLVPEEQNAQRLLSSLADFGFGGIKMEALDFVRPVTVALGRAPYQIDIMTFIKGVDIDAAWTKKVEGNLDGVLVYFISKDDLLENKRAVGRPEDLADVARLLKVAERDSSF